MVAQKQECKRTCKFAGRGGVRAGVAADAESAAGPRVAPEQGSGAVGQARGQASTRPTFPPCASVWPSEAGPLPSPSPIVSICYSYPHRPRRDGVVWLRGHGAYPLGSPRHEPFQLMTAAEMLQAVSNIRQDAEERLQSIQAQIEELEAEAERLQEVLA